MLIFFLNGFFLCVFFLCFFTLVLVVDSDLLVVINQPTFMKPITTVDTTRLVSRRFSQNANWSVKITPRFCTTCRILCVIVLIKVKIIIRKKKKMKVKINRKKKLLNVKINRKKKKKNF